MTECIKIKYWWSEDKKWFCVLTNDGVNQSTVSLTPEEAALLAMNASPAVADTRRTDVAESPPRDRFTEQAPS